MFLNWKSRVFNSADGCILCNVLKFVCQIDLLFVCNPNQKSQFSATSTTSRWQCVFNPKFPGQTSHCWTGLAPAVFHHVNTAKTQSGFDCVYCVFCWVLLHIIIISAKKNNKKTKNKTSGVETLDLTFLLGRIFPDRLLHQAAGGFPFAAGWRVYFCFCVKSFLVHPTRDYMTPYWGGKINYVNYHI